MTRQGDGDLAIVGLGMVTEPQPGRSVRRIEAEAARLAIEDAGLQREDVDGAIQLTMHAGSGSTPSSSDAFPRLLGLPVKFYSETGRGGGIAAQGIMAAARYLELGIANYVVVAVGANGWSRARRARQQRAERGNARAGGKEKEGYWGKPFGDLRAVSHHSFFAARHMHEFGTTSEQLGRIAVAIRQWATLNPRAKMYGRPMTLEDHQSSDVLVHPYHLLDCCLVSDGGIAYVLTTADRAKDAPKPPVYVAGVGFGEAIEELWWDKANYTRLAVKTAKEQAFSQAGITLKDIGHAWLYDCFTAEVLFQLEDYGWCGKGEGGPFVESVNLGPGGGLAINTNGGLMSAYHYADMTGLSEAVTQLRGEAGDRQLPNVALSMVTGHGGEVVSPGMSSMHSTLILRR